MTLSPAEVDSGFEIFLETGFWFKRSAFEPLKILLAT